MADPAKERNEILGNTIVKKLEGRGFEAFWCPTSEDALKKAIELIPEDHVVSWGGSVTIAQIGLQEYVRKNRKVIDRDTAKSPEERTQIMRSALLCDTFLMSANAISKDGEIVSIDGTGNRCAALIYGPKQVLIIAGINKIAGDLHAALSRAHMEAAAKNVKRFPATKTPCQLTGVCAHCNMPDTICNQVVITRRSKPVGRIKVIIVGEELGY